MSFTISLRRLPMLLGAAGVLAASLSSGCGGGGGSSAVTTPPINSSACAANTPHNDGRARWTVLVYMNSANNLLPDSFTNIAQMASVGSDSNVNIVVQWKQTAASQLNNPYGNDTPSFLGTRRYLIHLHSATDLAAINNHDTSSLETTDRLADPSTNTLDSSTGAETSDMGNINTLTNFLQWGIAAYPSDNIAVVIWNHGAGWRPVYANISSVKSTGKHNLPTINVPGRRAFSEDDNTANEIQTWQMPTAFANLPQAVDDLIFDASLEQMTEVAFQDRALARVQVGSEESPPGSGYPYDKWLTDLKSSGKNPCDLAGSIVKEFVASYSGQTGITQSYLDLSKMSNVASALEAFGVALLPHVNDQATVIANARANAVQYGSESTLYAGYMDLYGFANNIATTTNQASIKTAATNVMAALVGANGAILQNGVGASDEANSHGLSIYIPSPGNYLSAYHNLALATSAPHWQSFLTSQTQ